MGAGWIAALLLILATVIIASLGYDHQGIAVVVAIVVGAAIAAFAIWLQKRWK